VYSWFMELVARIIWRLNQVGLLLRGQVHHHRSVSCSWIKSNLERSLMYRPSDKEKEAIQLPKKPFSRKFIKYLILLYFIGMNETWS
jgi:hypothetical protein